MDVRSAWVRDGGLMTRLETGLNKNINPAGDVSDKGEKNQKLYPPSTPDRTIPFLKIDFLL